MARPVARPVPLRPKLRLSTVRVPDTDPGAVGLNWILKAILPPAEIETGKDGTPDRLNIELFELTPLNVSAPELRLSTSNWALLEAPLAMEGKEIVPPEEIGTGAWLGSM